MKSLVSIYQQIIRPENAKRPFIIFKSSSLLYGELAQAIRYITTLFKSYEISVGDRIVICSEHDEILTLISISALVNGITTIVLPSDIKPLRANSLVTLSKPKLIFASNETVESWGAINFCEVFHLIEQEIKVTSSLLSRFKSKKSQRWFQSLSYLGESQPIVTAEDDLVFHESLAFINFTSGTTEAPKGVQISYKNLFSHLETLGSVFGYGTDSKILNNLTLSHADGMIQGPILSMYYSATLCRPCSPELKNIESYLNTIHREHITHAITVPTVLGFIDRFSQYSDYFDTKTFRYLISVAGMLNKDLWQQLESRFNIRLSNIYGLTETVAGGIYCGPNDSNYRIGTIGKPIDMELAIVSPSGDKLKSNQQGEIVLKGENVFKGYLDSPKLTSSVMQGRWFKTGDIGFQDDEGFVYICGRSSELIISGGFNIHPSEVNEALMKHQNVVDAATFGVPHEDMQEIAMSAVVIEPNTQTDIAELIQVCRQSLEEYKVPKKIICVSELPRGRSGKVILQKLKEVVYQFENTNNSKINLEQFFTLVAQQFFVSSESLSLANRLGEIPGWDSLGHLNLVLAIEKAANISLSAHDIISISSLNDLWVLITQRKLNEA
jgi:long-chain acyl-CoA synthetase